MQTGKVSPVALLMMLQESFPASQLAGPVRPLEVVPFQLTSDALRLIAPRVLGDDAGDRQAFCQAFADNPAYLVCLPVVDKRAQDKVAQQFSMRGDMSEGLLGEGLGAFAYRPRCHSDIVVSIDPDMVKACDEVLHTIKAHAKMPGVPPMLLDWKMDVIHTQIKMFRSQVSVGS